MAKRTAQEVEELLDKLERELQPHCIDELEPIAPTTAALSAHGTNRVYLVPFFLPHLMKLASIYMGFYSTAGSVQLAAALYRVVNPDSYLRTIPVVGKAGGSVPGAYILDSSVNFELLNKGDPLATTAGSVDRYLMLLDQDRLLHPGIYAVGFQKDSANCVLRGGTDDSVQHGAFVGPSVTTFGDFPATIQCEQGLDAACPSFTLRTRKAMRRQGR